MLDSAYSLPINHSSRDSTDGSDELEDEFEDELEGPAEKIGVTAAVTQLDDALSSLNIQRSDPSTN